jgi:AcrR family transcriptional regulator
LSDPSEHLSGTVQLLWRRADTPVGRTGRTIGDFVDAAIDLARTEGVDALSMRRIAGRLGVRTMAAYTFAASKGELIALMVDRAYGQLYRETAPDTADWRQGLREVASANRALHLDQTWLRLVQPARSPMGPQELRKHELELAPLDRIGLSDFEMDQTLALVVNHAATMAELEARAGTERRSSSLDDRAWWGAAMPALEKVVDATEFPLSTRVGRNASAARDGQFWGAEAFEFGLECILDGVAQLIASRR